METSRVTALSIWGEPALFVGFTAQELRGVQDEFAGATAVTERRPAHVFARAAFAGDRAPVEKTMVRHRGGSSGGKYFSDGTPFDPAEQLRHFGIVAERATHALYELDGARCLCTPGTTLVQGELRNPYVLADLVENWLLAQARRHGWVQCHAAAWIAKGRATLIAGSSGAGKTTRLLAAVGMGATMLSNDRVFLRLAEGRLEVRGFPLPMNIGFGTIRGLKLDFPHAGRGDREKLRLRAPEVVQLFHPDYESWVPVERVLARGADDLHANVYWTEDDCHPFWNAMQRSPRGFAQEALWAALRDRLTPEAFDQTLLSVPPDPT